VRLVLPWERYDFLNFAISASRRRPHRTGCKASYGRSPHGARVNGRECGHQDPSRVRKGHAHLTRTGRRTIQ